MKILLKTAKIVDPDSPFHTQKKDLLIENNVIIEIDDHIDDVEVDEIITFENMHLSPGFVDMNCHIYDPGFEYREDMESGLRAAQAGGYTGICYMPNTEPVIDSVGQIEYIKKQARGHSVHIYPIGAVSKQCAGKQLAEMYDMFEAGAIAFSDGHHAIQNAGLLERALWYVKKMNGLVMNHPEDKQVSRNGSMNEGLTSVKLGVNASPSLAEEIMVARDIYLAEHTQSRLHFTAISTKRSVDLIRNAKKKGIRVTAGVNAYNLLLEDTFLSDFDTNGKVNPHLRTQEDMDALIKGLADGTIDVISSGHEPRHEDEKKVEFELAECGMIGLETCLNVTLKALENKIDLSDIITKMAINPRKILGLEKITVQKETKAEFVLYDPDKEFILDTMHIQSKSRNTPFVGEKMKGEIFKTIS